jgi:hypothetical protein
MVPTILAEMETHFPGRTALVNIHQGRSEGMLKTEHLHAFFANADAYLVKRAPETEEEYRVLQIVSVWQSAAQLQLQGPEFEHIDAKLVTFKSFGTLFKLISDMDDNRGIHGLKEKVNQTSDVITDAECLEIARSINLLTASRNDLHLGWKVSDNRRALAWFSRHDACPSFTNCPNNKIATAVRNWLGLSDIEKGSPVFAFVAEQRFHNLRSESALTLRRPTVFDGIDMPWFKHKRSWSYQSDNWGRATDLTDVLNKGEAVCDGGPEAVAQSVAIPGNFQCLYIGRVTDSAGDPSESFLNFLLGPYTLQDIIQKLLRDINSRDG